MMEYLIDFNCGHAARPTIVQTVKPNELLPEIKERPKHRTLLNTTGNGSDRTIGLLSNHSMLSFRPSSDAALHSSDEDVEDKSKARTRKHARMKSPEYIVV